MQDARVSRIESDLREFVRTAYPGMVVRAEFWARDPSRIALFFIDERFRGLYRRQRYHHLMHLIPKDYYDRNLADSLWFELTPDEDPEDLDDNPDEELVESITLDVMAVLQAACFFEVLDELFLGARDGDGPVSCSGDFRHAKCILRRCGIDEWDWSEVFHVLMGRGAFCDCEILLNTAPESKFRSRHWKGAAQESEC
jgi:hypothetical protein